MDQRSVDLDTFDQCLYEAIGREWPRWLGVPMLKNPLDLAIYAEILDEVRPRLIVETGTAFGGSALYLAHLCDALGAGHILSIDLLREGTFWPLPQHPRVIYLCGDSLEPAIIDRVVTETASGPVLVILDSDHHADHVRAECEVYGPLVTLGSYLIVEDTNMNGHPILWAEGPGPAEAVAGFLAEHPEFAADRSRERFLVTFNPGGYLKRVA